MRYQGRGPISDQPTSQLPATIQQAEVAIDQRAPNVVPALIADLGDAAAWRYVEFFTANIRNVHTRRAYAQAYSRFFAWCEDRGLTPATIRPHDVGTYIEQLQHVVSAPSVKQQLAAIRMLFDWLVTGQIVPNNPASAVRGPKYVVKVGKTPVLEADSWRKLLKSIPTTSVRDLRDRALIATLTYSFARISAALKMAIFTLRKQRILAVDGCISYILLAERAARRKIETRRIESPWPRSNRVANSATIRLKPLEGWGAVRSDVPLRA